MAKAKATAPSTGGMDDSKTWAFLAYLLSIVGFLLVMFTRKNDKYAMYHAKQSLVLFIAWVIVWVIMWIPFIGWLIGWILTILLVVLWILGMINALNGKQVPLPVIGQFADKINL